MQSWREVSLTDGIRSVEIPNIQVFFEFVNSGLGEADTPYLWRGQGNSEWPIESSLARQRKGGIAHIQNYRAAVARCTTKEFDLDGPDSENSKLRLWSIGQHNGLWTPLIDWTAYPFIALFFAFVERDDEMNCKEFRAVFALSPSDTAGLNFMIGQDIEGFKQKLYNPPYSEDFKRYLLNGFGFGEKHRNLVVQSNIPEDVRQRLCDRELGRLKEKQLHWFTPATNENPRLHSQGGCHCYTPDNLPVEAWVKANYMRRGAQWEKVPILTKILIPTSQRKAVLSSLNKMNVNWLSLFPDFEGAARHCNLTLLEGRFEGARNY